jgi:superfamily II DNA or RNA helicase
MKINQNISLRNWQKEAFKNWKINDFNGIFSVVTGGGKTIFGIYCLSFLFKIQKIDSTIIIVPTKTLQDQWASNLITHTDCSNQDISFNYKKLNKINILTNLSAQKIQFKDLKNKYSIIFDECHRYGTDNNLKILKENFSSKIGLTATLERKYDDGVNRILIPNIGKIIYDYDLKKALKDGVVENYEMIYLRTFFSASENTSYETLSKKISQLYAQLKEGEMKGIGNMHEIEKMIEILLFKRARLTNNSIQRSFVTTKLILNNLSRKKIIFCESIKQAEEIKKQCKKNNLETAIYHSKMKRSDRISILNNFNSNYYHTLIGCRALDEGFDVPDIDFGIIVSQTKTNRQRIQRLGRTIRKLKGKQKPIIYTLYTTEEEYLTLYEEQFNNPNIEAKWEEVN